MLAVPAPEIPAVAEDCGKRGVHALVVVSAGLDEGQARALLAHCRAYGMRLVGPNCLGIANPEDGTRLDATFAAAHPQPGTAGVAAQSGGVGIALLGGLARLGIGVSSFVSLGDKYDVSGNDLLQWWESDERTDLALLHLESFGNPRAFSRTARRVTRRMPILTVDAGRTDAGRRAAASHTAAAATTPLTRQALFTQAKITATRSVSELLESAALLHAQPLPTGRRVAVVTNAGGAGVLAADACAEAGLTLPPLGADLVGDLLDVLPRGATATNPVDATAAVTEDQLGGCLDRLATSEAVDAVLVALVPTAVSTATGDVLSRVLTRATARRSHTVAAVLLDQEQPVTLLSGATAAVPAYTDPQAAARALAHAAARAAWLARPPGTVPDLAGVDTPAPTPSPRPTWTVIRKAASPTRSPAPNCSPATALRSFRGPGPRQRTRPCVPPNGCGTATGVSSSRPTGPGWCTRRRRTPSASTCSVKLKCGPPTGTSTSDSGTS